MNRRYITGATLAECEAQLTQGETIIHTDGSRVTGQVTCVVAQPDKVYLVVEDVEYSPTSIISIHTTNEGARVAAEAYARKRDKEPTWKPAWWDDNLPTITIGLDVHLYVEERAVLSD